MSGEQKHPFHLVEPSPWPALGSMAAFVLAVGGVLFMHGHELGTALLGAGFMLVLATMFVKLNIRDIIHQSFRLVCAMA